LKKTVLGENRPVLPSFITCSGTSFLTYAAVDINSGKSQGWYGVSFAKNWVFFIAGLPIGSGLVESACKWLIQQRFKGVGMRWSEDGFDHLLHLRLAWVNERFDDLFDLAIS
jgi:hypothetical protein